MLLLLFIYSALGINIFGGLVFQEFINDKNNFQRITHAMMLLFRCSTGEDWNKVMYELGVQENCSNDQDFDFITLNNRKTRSCGVNSFAQLYMISFTVVISWLIMNLSVAAVIEGLENAK